MKSPFCLFFIRREKGKNDADRTGLHMPTEAAQARPRLTRAATDTRKRNPNNIADNFIAKEASAGFESTFPPPKSASKAKAIIHPDIDCLLVLVRDGGRQIRPLSVPPADEQLRLHF